MNDDDSSSFEQELRQINPATPPPALMQRLAIEPRRAADDCGRAEPAQDAVGVRSGRGWWIRWLAPVAATAVVAAAFWLQRAGKGSTKIESAAIAADRWMPEEIEVDRRLIAAFEGVARLPDGMPFRFRCYSWDEELVARDASGSVEVRQRAPRMEVVPVSLAVY